MYAVGRFLDWVEKKFKSGDWYSVPQETREFILKSLPVLQQALSLLQRFHLALFYLRGVFYHIAKRLTDVSYIKFSVSPTEGSSVQQSFQALGWLSLAQLGFSVLQTLYYSYRFSGTSSPQKDISTRTSHDAVDRKCCLCLEARRSPTATPCGHLFCWRCIYEWIGMSNMQRNTTATEACVFTEL